MKHTPTPWYVGHGYEQSDPGIYIWSINGGSVVCSEDVEVKKEDAEFIIKACNNYKACKNHEKLTAQRDALLKASHEAWAILQWDQDNCEVSIARQNAINLCKEAIALCEK